MQLASFSFLASDGKSYSLSDFPTKKVLFFFYPKDNTPGCTIENKDFSCLKEKFLEKNITVVGVSADSIASHQKFVADHDLSVLLLSDPEKKLMLPLEIWGEKTNYGKTYEGIIRSTVLVDKDSGAVEKIWRNVKAQGHAERILNEISAE